MQRLVDPTVDPARQENLIRKAVSFANAHRTALTKLLVLDQLLGFAACIIYTSLGGGGS